MSVQDILDNLNRKCPEGIEVVYHPKTGYGIVTPMGLGKIAANDIVFRDKVRWTMTLFWDDEIVLGESYVKVSSRPSALGTQHWEHLILTRYDVQEVWDVPSFNRVKLCFYGNGNLLESWDISEVKMHSLESDGGYGNDKSYYYEIGIKYLGQNIKYLGQMPKWSNQPMKNQVTIE